MKKILLIAAWAVVLGSANAASFSDPNIVIARGSSLAETISLSNKGSGAFTYTITLSAEGLSRFTGAVGSRAGSTYAQEFASLQGTTATQLFGVVQGYSSNSTTRLINSTSVYTTLKDRVNNSAGMVGVDNGYRGSGISGLSGQLENATAMALTVSYTAGSNGTYLFATVKKADGTVWTGSCQDSGLRWTGQDSPFSDWGTLKLNTSLVSSAYVFAGATTNSAAVQNLGLQAITLINTSLETTVIGAEFVNGKLALSLDPAALGGHHLSDIGGGVTLTTTDASWQAIVDAMSANGGTEQLVDLVLVAGDESLDVVKGVTDVTINGYRGEANGQYFVAYIPEPATATLSLLALTGLAARRRRK